MVNAMKKIKKIGTEDGFTLIETLIAMAIFTIGILGLFVMQTAAIKENLTANAITIGSTWATDRVERLLAMDYSDPSLALTVTTCEDLPKKYSDTGWSSAAPAESGTKEPIYKVYWAVAGNCLLSAIPDNSDAKLEQKPKYLRIIVTRSASDVEKEMVILNYIVQNI
ncbi:MAG: prepilin-type N-terminal cleavage/methylation domain-containing protein [Candidatus Electrothrix sp. AW3_4]|nr:prepilin-type N-terminal cleavage/methylation domain-containing protein [Candidatus Electrothrix gigas]